MRRKVPFVNVCQRSSFSPPSDGVLAAMDRQMSETDSSLIEFARRRLAIALDALEAACERRGDADRRQEALMKQIEALGEDRARLGSELDHAAARSRGLEAANREVAERLTAAIDTINGILKTSAVPE
jgi:septal ring factor EnvC (AmiA/AmiB activator)